MEEEQYHLDAFENYLILIHSGHNKTSAVKEVSLKYKVSETSVWKWKKSFNWDEREAIRSKEINKGVEEKTNSTIIENKATYLGIIHNIFNDYIADVEKGIRPPLKMCNTSDLVRLIYTALKIQKEDGDDTPIKVEVENKGKDDIPDEVVKEFGKFLIHRKSD